MPSCHFNFIFLSFPKSIAMWNDHLATYLLHMQVSPLVLLIVIQKWRCCRARAEHHRWYTEHMAIRLYPTVTRSICSLGFGPISARRFTYSRALAILLVRYFGAGAHVLAREWRVVRWRSDFYCWCSLSINRCPKNLHSRHLLLCT
jgi:hypothetical protein